MENKYEQIRTVWAERIKTQEAHVEKIKEARSRDLIEACLAADLSLDRRRNRKRGRPTKEESELKTYTFKLIEGIDNDSSRN